MAFYLNEILQVFLITEFFASFFSPQKELEKLKRMKRNQELEAVARDHYEKVLLRKKGLEPWKRLRMQSKESMEVRYHITPQIRK